MPICPCLAIPANSALEQTIWCKKNFQRALKISSPDLHRTLGTVSVSTHASTVRKRLPEVDSICSCAKKNPRLPNNHQSRTTVLPMSQWGGKELFWNKLCCGKSSQRKNSLTTVTTDQEYTNCAFCWWKCSHLGLFFCLSGRQHHGCWFICKFYVNKMIF